MVTSTFWSNVHERDSDVARVVGFVEEGARESLFCLKVSVNEGTDPAASMKSVLNEMQRGLADRTYDEVRFEALKRYDAVVQTYWHEDVVRRTFDMARSAHFGRSSRFLREQAERTLRARSSSVAAYWRQHLDPDRAHAIVVRPLPETERLPLALTGIGTARGFLMWKHGWPLDVLDRFPDKIVGTPFTEIVAISEHCRRNWVVALLGDEPRLRAAWSQASGLPLSQ